MTKHGSPSERWVYDLVLRGLYLIDQTHVAENIYSNDSVASGKIRFAHPSGGVLSPIFDPDYVSSDSIL
jgi:hypothetical protein